MLKPFGEKHAPSRHRRPSKRAGRGRPLDALEKKSLDNRAIMAALIARQRDIQRVCGDRFPLFTDAKGVWTLSRGGSWMGGFWTGLWWLSACLTEPLNTQRDNTGTERRQIHAQLRALATRLATKIDTESIHMALVFWFGCGLPARCRRPNRLEVVDTMATIARDAARVIADRFDAQLNCVPLGPALGGGAHARQTFCADSLAAVIGLLSDQGPGLARIARAHTDTFIDVCLRGDGACATQAVHQSRWTPLNSPGHWSRGQAWCALGLVAAACRWGGAYRARAELALYHWLDCHGTDIPRHSRDTPITTRDPSAAAIAATAFFIWAQQAPSSNHRWKQRGNRLLSGLIESPYLRMNTQGGAIFLSGHDASTGKEPRLTETVWGYYFLLLALALRDEVIPELGTMFQP